MGTTIRRQPITTPIPASPDYKFLNITNFGGIEKSSNPFVVSSNTASDCLNVYVDEDNALSTRPRLSPKYDLCKLAGVSDEFETIGVYPLHDGYLLHGLDKGTPKMFKFVETEMGINTPVKITPDAEIPVRACKLFEQNDKIYLLTGNEYKNIIDNVMSNVEGYIPTTNIGKHKKVRTEQSDGTIVDSYDLEGSSFESLNLLSDKYKESYFWDGTWDPYKIKDKDDELVETKYIESKFTEYFTGLSNDDIGCKILGYCEKASTNSSLYDYYYGYNYHSTYNVNSDGCPFGVFKFGKKNNIMVDFKSVPWQTGYPHDEFIFKVSSDGLQATLTNTSDVGLEGGNKYRITHYSRTSVDSDFSEGGSGALMSRPVKALVRTDPYTYYINHTGELMYATKGAGSTKISDYVKTFTASTDGKTVVYATYDESTGVLNKLHLFKFDDSYKMTDVELPVFWDSKEELIDIEMKIAPDNKQLVFTADIGPSGTFSTSKYWLYYVADVNSPKYEVLDDQGYWGGGNNESFRFSATSEKVYFKTGDFTGWVWLNDKFSIVKHFYELNSVFEELEIYTTNDKLVSAEIISFGVMERTFLFNSSEPLLYVTRKINSHDAAIMNFNELSIKFSQSDLFQRFDNNMWFASGNTTFHTLYNDPTYVPMSSYNDLGEDYDYITGLSIVNDNILAAYKRDRIYIITPITIGDSLTYSYTETKNVIGNYAINAPILTILTEMPTIVSYDGIFALNQLENVQSSDRITTLISEAINPLWLKESKSDIDGCLTLNRLYWTYYILPHEQVGDKTYTKVYLLDNRTQQWYYWELPLLVTNAFVKNDKTHLVNSSGRVFTLETSDLVNEYNTDVTEYYDNIDNTKLIIPWHWYSQILSLNTINYSKRLVDTTFILTDTDTQDEYALDYSFKAWRKSVSETNATTINSNIHYVQSTTKRTMIPRFNFIQFRINNTEDDLDNNKLRLVGLGLKYVLLEGLY